MIFVDIVILAALFRQVADKIHDRIRSGTRKAILVSFLFHSRMALLTALARTMAPRDGVLGYALINHTTALQRGHRRPSG